MSIQIVECRTQQRFQLYTGASSSSTTKANNALCPYEEGVMSRGAQEALLDRLPEDLLHHIYSLVPLQDAARAACVSRKFLHFWRHYPNLTLNWNTLGLIDTKWGLDEVTSTVHGQSSKLEKRESYLVTTIDHILKNHSGIGMETFKLHLCASIDAHYLDSWLQKAAKSRVKELVLALPSSMKTQYNFPCGLLCSELGRSLQSLRLYTCAFRPESFGYLTRLTRLVLHWVLINEEQLTCLLSNSFALVKLEMFSCNEIVHLRIPCTLSKLSFLRVLACKMLQAVEINAPNLTGFHYGGSPAAVQMFSGDMFELREMHLWGYLKYDMILYARTKLPSIAPNVESLNLMSHAETVNTPMAPGKFLHLKSLDITLSGRPIFCPRYNFFSLISFMDASPALESFALHLKQDGLRQDSIVGDSSGGPEDIRQKPECRFDCLKKVTITGFCSAKSLVELTSYIVENTPSLESLTLDTTLDKERNFPKMDKCFTMSKEALLEAHRSVEAIRRYITGKVPSNICLEVIEPCKRCQSHIVQDA